MSLDKFFLSTSQTSSQATDPSPKPNYNTSSLQQFDPLRTLAFLITELNSKLELSCPGKYKDTWRSHFSRLFIFQLHQKSNLKFNLDFLCSEILFLFTLPHVSLCLSADKTVHRILHEIRAAAKRIENTSQSPRSANVTSDTNLMQVSAEMLQVVQLWRADM